ncbi:hypothetical protein [Fusobacterium sp.]|uniref:hypothetical protein n=1 Tax=Fusobacterium sp. TaxID=68766 RepID=UPI00261DB8EB|nr:hypothetical protein [Fusobacterium sp.]
MIILKFSLFIIFGIALRTLKNKVSSIYERKTGFPIFAPEYSRTVLLAFIFLFFSFGYYALGSSNTLSILLLALFGFSAILILTYKAYRKTNLKYAIIAFLLYLAFLIILILIVGTCFYLIYYDMINRHL